MKVEIIATGSEIIKGRSADTNNNYIARKLTELGFDVIYHSVYRDDLHELIDGIRLALRRSDLVITTGGLGPTVDDLIREAVSKAVNTKLVFHKDEYDRLKRLFKKKHFNDSLKRQCYFPQNCTLISNHTGSATGFLLHKSGRAVASLSGVPIEMNHMLESVLAIFKVYYGSVSDKTSLVFKIFGISESVVDNKFKQILKFIEKTYTYSISAKGLTVTVHIEIPLNINLVQRLHEKVLMSFGDSFVTSNEEKWIEDITAELLLKKWKKVAVAESCTGGLILNKLTNVPGISASLLAGLVTYSNEAKVSYLKVSEKDLFKYGAVSDRVALEMAKGIRLTSKADIGISTTGIAGPVGGTKDKPVGLVYFGISTTKGDYTEKYVFKGDRLAIKENASNYALNILRMLLLKP